MMFDSILKDCRFVREHLSAYMDGELAEEQVAEVAQHLDGCDACSSELAQFQQLGDMARQQAKVCLHPFSLSGTASAAGMPSWESIANRLDDSGTSLAAGASVDQPQHQAIQSLHSMSWKWIGGMAVSLAASVLFLIMLRPVTNNQPIRTDQASVATLNLQPLLEMFGYDSQLALDQLTRQFETKEVDLEQAEISFGRPTFVSMASRENPLPGNATVASTKVLSSPFCKCPVGECVCGPGGCGCVACVCERPDGSTYLVLEHCKSQSVSFGDLPVQLVNRDGRQIQQVTVDGTQAISFERPTGRITVVGLRGDHEITSLLASN